MLNFCGRAQETAALISARMLGVPKSAAHRAAISAGQRRRQAAKQLLHAVEAAHAAAEQPSAPAYSGITRGRHAPARFCLATSIPRSCARVHGEVSIAPAGAQSKRVLVLQLRRNTGVLAHLLAYTAISLSIHRFAQRRAFASGGGSVHARAASAGGAKGKLRDPKALEGYKAELREFRALQRELEQWTGAFRAKHARKPSLGDVEATGALLPLETRPNNRFMQAALCNFGGLSAL